MPVTDNFKNYQRLAAGIQMTVDRLEGQRTHQQAGAAIARW